MSKSAVTGRCRALFREIQAVFADNVDEARVAKYQRFFVEGYDAYGIELRDPKWEERQQRWLDENADLGLGGFLQLGDLLVGSGKYEEAYLAYRFVAKFRESYTPAAFDHIGGWFALGICNWAHTDVLCRDVLHQFVSDSVVDFAALAKWRDSEFKFQRRAVPVTLVELLDETTQHGELLDLIRPMMMDAEKVVQQGLGWFLRETWKRRPKLVEPFLLEFKDDAPRLIFQYATEKMTAANKKRFRRAKKTAKR